MNRKIYNEYVTILESELVPALGCTEPIALAYDPASFLILLMLRQKQKKY